MTKDEERFAARIQVDENGCWIWHGSRGRYGHGQFWVDGRYQYAYRWAYEAMIGPIPEGLTLDHLCRTPSCANPFHCEPVPLKMNILRGIGPTAKNARKQQCKHNHLLTGRNLGIRKENGNRYCRECKRVQAIRKRAKARNGS